MKKEEKKEKKPKAGHEHQCQCGHEHDHEEGHQCRCEHGHDHEEGHQCQCEHEEGHECQCGHDEGHQCQHEEGHQCCGHEQKVEPTLEEKYADIYDRYLRALADIKNMATMMEKEKTMIRKYAFQMTLESLLPVLDSFEIAFKATIPNQEAENYRKGFEFIYQMLMQVLSSHNATPIEPVIGEDFNPNIHHANEKEEVDDPEKANKIVQVYRKGYKLNDRVIRGASVRVSVLKTKEAEEPQGGK